MNLVSGIVFMAVLSLISYKKEFVDITGLISGFGIGLLVWYLGGIGPFVLLFGFFIVSSVATKYKYKYKKKRGVSQEGKGKRGWRNVLGSGILPSILVVLMYIAGTDEFLYYLFYVSYVCSIATTTADTLASELGVLSKTRPRMITSLTRRVKRGTPGAVSGLGLKAELFSSLIVGFFAGLFYIPINASYAIMIVLITTFVGFLGANIDSLIGALDSKFDLQFDNSVINIGSSVIGCVLGVVVVTGTFVTIVAILITWLAVSVSN